MSENTKTLQEDATRNKILSDAMRRFGPEGVRQLKILFNKWDGLIAKCTNESEVAHMKKMACAEIFSTIGYSGGLVVGGNVIIPPEEENKA